MGGLHRDPPAVVLGIHRLGLAQAGGHVEPKTQADAVTLRIDPGHALRLPHGFRARFALATVARPVEAEAVERHDELQTGLVADGQRQRAADMPTDGSWKRIQHHPHIAETPRVERSPHSPYQHGRARQQEDAQQGQQPPVGAFQRLAPVEERERPGNRIAEQGKPPRDPHLVTLVGPDAVAHPFAPGSPWLRQGLGRLGGQRIAPAAPGAIQHARAQPTEEHHEHHLEHQQAWPQAAVEHGLARVGRIDPGGHRHTRTLRALQPAPKRFLKIPHVIATRANSHPVGHIDLPAHLVAEPRRDAIAAGLAAARNMERRRLQRGHHRLPALHAPPVVQGRNHAEQQRADAHGGKGQGKQRQHPEASFALATAHVARGVVLVFPGVAETHGPWREAPSLCLSFLCRLCCGRGCGARNLQRRSAFFVIFAACRLIHGYLQLPRA